jgi:hypothetical protein
VLVIDDFFHQSQGPARAVERYFGSQNLAAVYHISFPYSVVVFKGERPVREHRRAIDGNRYSLDLLRQEQLLRDAVARSAAHSEQVGAWRHAEDARLLLSVLEREGDSNRDIYDYWRALANYWDKMDSDRPDLRDQIAI